MARSSISPTSAQAVPPRLLLSLWNKFFLVACIAGLLAAWLVFAAFDLGSVGPGAGYDSARSSVAGSTRTAAAPVRGLTSPVPSLGAGITPAASQPAATSEPSAVPRPVASAPQRISYPAAHMDLAVHSLQPSQGETASQSIVPPETMDGYWLAPFGVPGTGSTNTTYIVGHSWQGLDAPFNHLSTAAAPGDELTVQTATGIIAYKVDSVTTYTKSTLKDSPVWKVVPNRVVLISCYTGDLWGKNVVVVASPILPS